MKRNIIFTLNGKHGDFPFGFPYRSGKNKTTLCYSTQTLCVKIPPRLVFSFLLKKSVHTSQHAACQTRFYLHCYRAIPEQKDGEKLWLCPKTQPRGLITSLLMQFTLPLFFVEMTSHSKKSGIMILYSKELKKYKARLSSTWRGLHESCWEAMILN